MTGYGVPVVVVPHCKPQLASHPAFTASLGTLGGVGVRVLFDPGAPYEQRLPPWSEVTAALPARAPTGGRDGLGDGRAADRAGQETPGPVPGGARRSGRQVESWLSQVERGRRGIDSHAVLMRLAEVLRIDIEEIITRPRAPRTASARSRPRR